MKRTIAFLSLIFVVLFPLFSHGLESVSGYFLRDGKGTMAFYSYEDKKTYSLEAGNKGVVEQLKKLESLDALRGMGNFNNASLIMDSIDFVGLRRLIGEWQGKSMVLQFRTFVDVSLYSFQEASAATRGDYKYALTPADGHGDQWKVFFTDENQVALASLLLLGPSQAVLTFYHSQTGEVVRTIPMTKMRKK